jgi:hypothetical protein
MKGLFRLGLLAAALGVFGVTSVVAQTATPSEGLRLMAGPGIGFGSGGVHITGAGDSKPGAYVLGRIGLARNNRPFLAADLEWQVNDAPVPLVEDEKEKTSFGAVSTMIGVAIYPTADFYLMPQAGMQFRNWDGPRADEFSDSGFAAGLNLGYHLSFGPSFGMAPEVMLRYAVITGPDAPSYRAIAFRVMAHWMF